MKRRLVAATLAAGTALSLSTATALEAHAETAQSVDTEILSPEHQKLVRMFETKGPGAVPNIERAGMLAAGSVNQGSSGERAYFMSQVGWTLLWTAVATGIVIAAIRVAEQAGLVKLLV